MSVINLGYRDEDRRVMLGTVQLCGVVNRSIANILNR